MQPFAPHYNIKYTRHPAAADASPDSYAIHSEAFLVLKALTDARIAAAKEEVDDDIWLVSFMDYDLGYIELEQRTVQPLENPFGPKVVTGTNQ